MSIGSRNKTKNYFHYSGTRWECTEPSSHAIFT